MDKLLKKLFDYQKFEGNQKLQSVIELSETYQENALNDEQLSFVFGGKKIEDQAKDLINNKTSK